MGTITLSRLIAHVESNDNPHATRFESGLWERRYARCDQWPLSAVKKANKCSDATAMAICCTSYGAFQFMGFNLYGPVLQYRDDIAVFLTDPAEQAKMFTLFVGDRAAPFADDMTAEEMRKFAAFYNGPKAPDAYVARMQAVMKQLSGGSNG